MIHPPPPGSLSSITAKHTSPNNRRRLRLSPLWLRPPLKPNFSLLCSFLSANFRQFRTQRRRRSGSDCRVTVIRRRERRSQTLLYSVLGPPPSADKRERRRDRKWQLRSRKRNIAAWHVRIALKVPSLCLCCAWKAANFALCVSFGTQSCRRLWTCEMANCGKWLQTCLVGVFFNVDQSNRSRSASRKGASLATYFFAFSMKRTCYCFSTLISASSTLTNW